MPDGRFVCSARPLGATEPPDPHRPPPFGGVDFEIIAGDAPLELDATIDSAAGEATAAAKRHLSLGPGERRRTSMTMGSDALYGPLCRPRAEPVVLVVRSRDAVLARASLTRKQVLSVGVVPRPTKHLPHGAFQPNVGARLGCDALPAETTLRFAFAIEDDGPFRLVHRGTREQAAVEVGSLDHYMMGGRVEHRASFARLPVPPDACRTFPVFSVGFQHTKKAAVSGSLDLGFSPQEIEVEMVNEPVQIAARSKQP